MTITAHLNGGPWADEEYELAGLVPVTVEQTSPAPTTLAAAVMSGGGSPMTRRKGMYRPRSDSNAEGVPHSLTAYEYDWQGWL